MQFRANRLIFLKIPKEVVGEVEIREFSNKGVSGSVLLTRDKTYRLVCREDSNTFLMKLKNSLSKIDMCLECKDLKYGEKEILSILPEVNLATINNSSLFIPKEKVMLLYPMTENEYSTVLSKNRSVWTDVSGKMCFAKVAAQTVIEALLLTRSLIISKETRNREEIEAAFVEILPKILFQVVLPYIVDGEIDDVQIKMGLIDLFKQTSKTEEEFTRNMTINWLG